MRRPMRLQVVPNAKSLDSLKKSMPPNCHSLAELFKRCHLPQLPTTQPAPLTNLCHSPLPLTTATHHRHSPPPLPTATPYRHSLPPRPTATPLLPRRYYRHANPTPAPRPSLLRLPCRRPSSAASAAGAALRLLRLLLLSQLPCSDIRRP
eukprot:362316-Prymnesium_polylepis.1